MDTYKEFLERKRISAPPCGLAHVPALNSALFDFQRDIVAWALRRGRAAIFADCGLGKTLMQLEWARHIPGRVLILAPLAVAAQTVREGDKFGIGVTHCRDQSHVRDGINITNYEMLQHFDPSEFTGIVLDESSILKSYDGKTRTEIINAFAMTQYRLACTATPAPNDYMELGNHAEFLNVMSRVEMLATFFVHDGGETQKWRLKGHAEHDFWAWLASWAVMIRKPQDLGYFAEGFELPELVAHEITVRVDEPTQGFLFPVEAQTLQERIAARRDTLTERVADCAAIVNASSDQFIVWCNLNNESDELRKAIPGSVDVKGSDGAEAKERAVIDFIEGRLRVLISKPSMFGYGLNLQCCHNMAFVGLSDSWEQYYQAVRRCWRFGQNKSVNVYLVCAETEGAVLSNLKRKEADAARMAESMVAHMAGLNQKNLHEGAVRMTNEYNEKSTVGEGWEMRLGDCVEHVSSLPDNSVDFTVYSPPFASLYTYSNSDRDMGNCKDYDEFAAHYAFLVRELFRATKPGRLVSFHCMNLPTSKTHHGYIGIRDFRGELIRMHEAEGWIFHSEVCIWKDPVTAMQRTKALGLLHKQLKKDSCMSRQGIPDYLVTMRKPGDNAEPVNHTNETFPVQEWQRIASPVWMDINPSDTLQYMSAREHNDERHICPLQLEVIRRALMLWSKPGDLVLSPFAGIGSEGFVSVQMGRRFIGVELKRSYHDQAVKNLIAAGAQQSLLELAS
jgi:superfamily II DNA or RNA helicase